MNGSTCAILLVLAVVGLSACGGGETASGGPVLGGDESAPPTQIPSPTPAPTPSPTPPGIAVSLYFSDCQTGAQAGCVPGNNANAGTSPSAPRQNLAGLDVNALAAGSQLLFARGGAWTNFNVQIRNLNATAGAPLVFDAYSPTWGGTSAPWIRAGGTFYAFQFGTYNDTTSDGGYVVRNLKLDGQNIAGAWGIHVRSEAHDLVFENLEITGFEIAMHLQNMGAAGNVNVALRNSTISRNSGMGLLGDAVNLVVEGNTFAENNFSGSSFNHAIYLGGHGRNGVIRNNIFTNNSAVNGICTGGNLTVHGQWDGLLVEGNTVQQAAAGGGCYGISINGGYNTAEYFRNLVLRSNRVINVGGCGICLTSAPGALIENNLIVNTQATYLAGILIPANPLDGGDDPDGGAIIRNNTIYYSRAAAGSEGVALRANSGRNVQVVSNLVYFGGTSDPYHACFSHRAPSDYSAFNNNLCHHASGAGQWSWTYSTLSTARNAGLDVAGLSVDPLFVALPAATNNWNDQIQAGSPAADAGNTSLSSRIDRLGVMRIVPNIGSRE